MGDVVESVASAPGRAGDLLAEVLSDLVGQQVITQDQADAITDELDTRRDAKRAEMQARREEMRAVAEQVRGFLDDEVITADEVAQLPDGELKNALEGLLADGDITLERLRELGAPFLGRGRHGHAGPGHLRGPGMFDTDGADEETDQTETETDSQDS